MGLEDLPELGDKPRRRVLAICGGGYAGMFAAEFLSRLEERLGQSAAKTFDLISGTSIGGLLAIGLAYGMPAKNLSLLLQELGPQLFGKPGFGVLRPKHDRSALEAKLMTLFGEKTLATLGTKVLIPAVNLTGGEAIVYRNLTGDPTRGAKIVDVALATSAAPYFLTPHAADHQLYADGGLIANSPEALAVVDALHRHRWGRDRTTLVVVGSTQKSARLPGHLINAPWGAADWLKDQRLLTATMRAQMSLARQMSVSMLGSGRVLAADVELTDKEAKTVALDKANPKATQDLKTLAAGAFDRFLKDHASFFRSI
jgi:uncharacterized protein